VFKGEKAMQDEEDARPRIKLVEERKEKFVDCENCVFRDYVFKENKAGGLQEIKLDCAGGMPCNGDPPLWVRSASDTNLWLPESTRKGCWYGLPGPSLSVLPWDSRVDEHDKIIAAFDRLQAAIKRHSG
jgi:hypothetical protein